MSYILDALRKSEQERQRGKVPDYHSTPVSDSDDTGKKNYWPVIIAAIVVANVLIVFGLWQYLAGPAETVDLPTEMLQADPIQPPAREQVPATRSDVQALPQPTTRVPEPVSEPKPQPEPARTEPEPDVSVREPSIGYVPQLEELPSSQRNSIPDLMFSSHMYSSMPKYRSVIINGKRLKEGQRYNQDLIVREITDTGVIMSHGSTLFQVDVLGRWAQ